MIVLDENILTAQRLLLKKWRLRVHHIGQDFGRPGLKDVDDIIPLLHSLNQPSLLTRDLGLYDRGFCHRRYCLVCLDVEEKVSAQYIRKFLRHLEFNTKAKRMGKVVRLSPTKIHYWSLKMETESVLDWKK